MPDISPSRGEISRSHGFRQSSNVARRAPAPEPPISPLEGEMSGRTERGATDRGASRHAA
ncbi:MAG: hypothetical protein EOS63_08720 [Mesorhizobium sp.]|nr:MAG: hypothetical protein EOS63_08720 [Mesorhizobium sp.]TIT09275.1 MAG: hypothetical protein E5W74_20510 [Mesorhizobium sp.]TJW62922.1 MAG: hypothetical protein E5V97_15110 [Mesorhizobium sp.]